VLCQALSLAAASDCGDDIERERVALSWWRRDAALQRRWMQSLLVVDVPQGADGAAVPVDGLEASLTSVDASVVLQLCDALAASLDATALQRLVVEIIAADSSAPSPLRLCIMRGLAAHQWSRGTRVPCC
jgi:hypothetical protein